MSDRFDEMRSKGINTNDATATAGDILSGKTAYARGQKIIGSYVPSSTDNYNIYMQTSEPTSKDGVWIKKNGTVEDVIFLNAGAEGDFLVPDDYTYLDPSTYAVAQIIVGGKMYIFGADSNSSWVYDLHTKQGSHINVPTIAVNGGTAGACYWEGDIYIFYGRLNWYKYNIETNTYETLPSISGDDESGHCTNIHVYNGYAYFYTNNSHSTFYSSQISYFSYLKKVNLSNGTLTYVSDSYHSNGSGGVSGYLGGYGKYLYFFRNRDLYRRDLEQESTSLLKSFTSSQLPEASVWVAYPVENEVYIFRSGSPSNPEQSRYYKYNITNDTLETFTTQFPYSIYSMLGTNSGQSSTYNNLLFDDTTGILYFRSAFRYSTGGTPAYYYYYYPISVFQLSGYPDVATLDDGTVSISQSTTERITKLKDSDNLHVGIGNVYIVDDGELDGDILVFWGDGANWNLLKNPDAETVTVSFDTAGGSGTFPSQQVIIGQKATEPQDEPTKTGEYIFDSWYLGNEPYDWNYKPISDITLTAHYIEYEEVEYIQSTGTQYIDTGIYPKSTTRMVVEFAFPKSSTAHQFNGWGAGGGAEAFIFGLRNTVVSNDPNTYITAVSSNYTQRSTLVQRDDNKHTFDLQSGSQKFDGTQYSTDTIGDTATSDQTMYLFGLHGEWESSEAVNYSEEKIYSCKIYDNGTLVRDFQPIQITSTGEYCLLDEVNSKVYHNAGTGAFDYGEVVE